MTSTETLLIILALITIVAKIPMFINPKAAKKRVKKFKFSDQFITLYSICMGVISLLLLSVLFLIMDPKLVLLVMFATFFFVDALLTSSPSLLRGMVKLTLKEKNSWSQAMASIAIIFALLTLTVAIYF